MRTSTSLVLLSLIAAPFLMAPSCVPIPPPGGGGDDDAGPMCGDGVVDPGETCDGSCPTSCNDSNACTTDTLTGTQCTRTCGHSAITACVNGDGCCAPGCTAATDNDCMGACGNNVVEPGENCDGNCPTSCNDGNACTTDTLMGTACARRCLFAPITMCVDGDGCCAPGCNANTDDNCIGTCGNNIVEAGENCDGNCPTSCNDNMACTTDTLSGTACTRRCASAPITTCVGGDSCCAPGCNANNDSNCTPVCGNNVVETGESCDGSCPTSCNDGNACTTDTLSGTACTRRCTSAPITTCVGGDGCCAPGCNANNDNNCMPICGNNVVEPGEICDGSCPTSCNDGNACTTDTLSGTGCSRGCQSTAISTCANGDGCCAPGCNANNDNSCLPVCGNGVLESGEICDGNCPSTCAPDTNACTRDVLTGSVGMCNAQCTHPAITTCTNADGCCPSGCANANDNDCAPPAPTTCTLEYDITPTFRLTGTPLGAGDGMWTLPTGKVIVRVDSDATNAPRVGGKVELLFMWVPTRFSVVSSGLTLATNVNGFVSSCNGTTNPPPAGQTAPPFTTPPATCAYTPGTSSMATGTYNGTTVVWDQCTRAASYGTNDYTPASTSVSTGPGCAKGYRAVGVLTCTDNSILVSCATANLLDGQNVSNDTFNQPLETVTLTNGYNNASIPFAAVPNNSPGSSTLSWTGVRNGGTCR